MAELFKNIYNTETLGRFAAIVKEVVPAFEKESFLKRIFDKDWEEKELKQRMRHISITLHTHLSQRYDESIRQLLGIIENHLSKGIRETSIEFMFFPDFIELYGLDDFETSVNAFETVTQFTSCEFGVRPFIIRYPEEMIQRMKEWSEHEHPAVRRLSTEGCRPRLPWAMAIPDLKKDPAPILPILKRLKTDPSESVRRSVANNLNDISKDNPDLVLDLAYEWQGQNKDVDWVVKHACRTLLKQGHPKAMTLFGFGSVKEIEIRDLEITTPVVKLGNSLEFNFSLENKAKKESKIRLEYAIYFLKANKSLAKKVFTISEKAYAANSVAEISRKQPFKLITTRKLYEGGHKLALIINGNEQDQFDFEFVL
ncbi:MAG: DNA alkylation repair protein [Roseivirga sp.]|nr:DNA alkylation repair protein [Roseivirga sp.]